ncbi:MAG: hypothetical protein WBF58_07010 [Xanthobacteraceae bacterium]
MLLRVVLVCACALGVTSALAEDLSPDQARAFIAGKLFTYNCFDGTSGVGRIFRDGSVIGTIRPPGSSQVRFAHLPPGTLRITPTSVCANLPGMPIEPCFRVQKIDYRSFRGSISGLGFAYCDFYQRNPRASLMRRHSERAPSSDMAAVRPPR